MTIALLRRLRAALDAFSAPIRDEFICVPPPLPPLTGADRERLEQRVGRRLTDYEAAQFQRIGQILYAAEVHPSSYALPAPQINREWEAQS